MDNNTPPHKVTHRPTCYNCKHGGDKFKIDTLTHLHCQHPQYEEGLKNGTVSPWDTLRVFYNTCTDYTDK